MTAAASRDAEVEGLFGNGWVAVLAGVSLLTLGVALLGFLRLVLTRTGDSDTEDLNEWRRP